MSFNQGKYAKFHVMFTLLLAHYIAKREEKHMKGGFKSELSNRR